MTSEVLGSVSVSNVSNIFPNSVFVIIPCQYLIEYLCGRLTNAGETDRVRLHIEPSC